MRTKGVTELRRTQRTSLNEGSPRLAFTCPAYGASAFAASTSGRVVNQSQNCWYCPDLVSRPRPTPSPQIQRNTHPRLTINQVRVRPTPDAKVREPLTHAREGVAAQRAAQRGAMELLDVGLALELRIDVAELLLAVDDLGVVPLERVPDGVPLRLESVPLREVACRDVTFEVALESVEGGFADGDIALAFRCGEFVLQTDDGLDRRHVQFGGAYS